MSAERAMRESLWVMGPEAGVPAWLYFLGSSGSALPTSYLAQPAVPHQLSAGSRMN